MPRRIQSTIYAGFQCSCDNCGVSMVLTQSQVLRQRKIKSFMCDSCYNEKRQNDIQKCRISNKCKYTQLVGKARDRGIDVTISFEFYDNHLASQPCHYCGDVVVHGGGGVDRVDSSKGYVEGNVVPCCPTCNVLKMDRSYEDTIQHMIKMLSKAGYNINKEN